MCTFIASCPEIIIIILNRGKGIQYKVKINFPIQLNLYNFIDFKEAGYNYELIGVITSASKTGSTIGPPAEAEYAVEPVGVQIITPSDFNLQR